MRTSPLSLAIDASRNRSGGAIAHLMGLIEAAEPERHGFSQVHVWSYQTLLRALPNRPWLVRHNPPELERSIAAQLRWQRWQFPRELKKARCQIVLNTDAGTVSRFRPAVTMSRDMLSYEPGEMERYGLSKARLRLWLLRHVQNRSLRSADGAIFLTRYAASVIQDSCGTLSNVAIVPHGVRDDFRQLERSWPAPGTRSIRCLYVSNTAPYKHQWVVVRAVERLRQEGYPILLRLVGGGHGSAQALLDRQVAESDAKQQFVTQTSFVSPDALGTILNEADLYVFASSCENMPNTLLEGMAAGFPIACSNRGPMPEVLNGAGVLFDPENAQSIATAIRQIIDDPDLRTNSSTRARIEADKYSWKRCADETLSFVAETYRKCSK